MFRYKFLDYPKIPQDIIDNIRPGAVIREYPGRTCFKNNKEFNTSSGTYYFANPELDAWARTNINADIDFVGIRYQYGSTELPSQGAHTDATRTYGILYIVDNADGNLTFWQQDNQAEELNRLTLITDYDTLTELESVATPNNTWYVVNGQVLHSVENMSRTRTTIQINLKSLAGIDL